MRSPRWKLAAFYWAWCGVGLFACGSPARDFSTPGHGGAAGTSSSGDAGKNLLAGTGGTAPEHPDDGEAGASSSAGTSGSPGDESSAGDLGSGGSAGAPELPLSDDVVGLLYDVEGEPVVGASIEIDGRVVSTDGNGAFTVMHVPAKYDAVIVSQLHKEVHTYEGLSTRTPHFTLLSSHLVKFTAKLRGGLSGGAGFPTPAGHSSAVTAVAADRSSPAKATVSGSGYTFTQLDHAARLGQPEC